MAAFYASRIKKGKLTIDSVPVRWREETERLLAAEGGE